ncbi:MAG: polysaccharide pyruvyl transferase family protein [Gammaproteobacteria bacterium]
MRIGILTFHKAINYGAVMQCFALKQYLTGCGHQVDVIDYVPAYLRNQYSVFRKPRRGLFVNLNRLLLPFKFRGFYDAALNPFRFSGDWAEIDRYFDCVICGGDQIWNGEITKGVDWNYYAGELKDVRKLAYAASMAETPFASGQLQGLAECLREFAGIGVRERFAAEQVARFSLPAQIVIDPVFLFDFKGIGIEEPAVAEPYILTFFYQPTVKADRIIQEVKEKTGYKVMNIGICYQREADRNVPGVTPLEWLGWIRNASFVVTESFHCVSFSVMYQREFAYITRSNRNNRVLDLLASVGLSGRVCDDRLPDEGGIDYAGVGVRLGGMVAESRAFLAGHLR